MNQSFFFQPSVSCKSSTSSRSVRGPAKKLKDGVKYNIDAIIPNGEPREPKKNVNKFILQCGVIVRDQILIFVRMEKGSKGRSRCYFCRPKSKDFLWESLMSHFTLPDHLTDADLEKVKKSALKKMAIAFNNHKKKYGPRMNKTERRLQNSREHWRRQEITRTLS